MKTLLSLTVGCLISLSAWAQETVAVNTGDLVSPEVKGQTVTFKLLALQMQRKCWWKLIFSKRSNGRLRLA